MKTLRFLVCAALAMASNAAGAATHFVSWTSADGFREGMTPGGPTFHLPQGVMISDVDWPCRVLRIEIPPDAVVTSVRIRAIEEQSLLYPPGDYRFPEAEIGMGEPSVAQSGHLFWILPHGDYLGHRIAHLLVNPFRTDEGQVLFLRAFELEIETGAAPSAATARRVIHPRTEAADRKALGALLDLRMPFEPPSGHSAPLALPPEMEPETTEFVVITTEAMASAFTEFVEIKTREGFPAKLTTVEWILEHYEGNDLEARIRSYLRDLYLYQGLRYALIGGDTGQVPMRLATTRFQANPYFGIEVTTDLYFACLDGDWNADGDHQIGEGPFPDLGMEGDDADLYPEISVSRVPCGTLQEAITFVTKWKSYTGYDPANFRDDYQAKILSLGEVLFPPDWQPGDDPGEIYQDGADFCESTLAYVPPVFLKTRMYEYDENPNYPDAIPEIRDSVIVRINEGYGVVDHVGHGFRTTMSVGDGSLYNSHADAFTNTNAYSLLYAINCSSASLLYDCIVEHFVANPTGGAVAAVAAGDLDYPTNSTKYKVSFFNQLFNEDVSKLADTQMSSYLQFVPLAMVDENVYRWTMLILTVVGDPGMEIWRDHPRTLELDFAPTTVVGAGSFTVSVSDGGAPVAGAQVCLWKSDGYGVGVTDGTGVTTIDFLPTTQGTFRITATKNSYIPAMDEATVLPAATAALRIETWSVHDGAGGGSGNNDGRPDAGESIVVELALRNNGPSTATSVQAILHANCPFLEVSDSTATFPNIGPGGTATVASAFTMGVSADLPDTLRHVVAEADLELRCNQGTWTEPWPFNVYQRILDLTHLEWSIGGDDGDGILESGETAEILITLANMGEGFSPGVAGFGATGSPGFLFLEDTIDFGDVASDQAVQAGTLSILSLGGGAGDLVIDFTVSDDYSAGLLTRELDLIAPSAPDTVYAESGATWIDMTWVQPSDQDLRGYRVYRADAAGGPYAEITGNIAEAGSFYVDEDLPALTGFYYRVASVDSSGNTSELSGWTSASTSPAYLEGWPVEVEGGASKGSPTFVNLDDERTLEIALGSKYPMVFRANGGDFVDGDDNALTVGVFSTVDSGLTEFNASPPAWDIDNDDVMELVFSAWQTTEYAHMWVLDATGAVDDGWPRNIGHNSWSSPAVGDVDGDGDCEIFTVSGSGTDPYRGVVFGFHHNGSEILDGDNNSSTHGVFYKSSNSQARYMYGSVALADIDSDTLDEIIFLEKTQHAYPSIGNLYVFDGDASVLDGFPYAAPGMRGSTSSPVVADLDRNGDLEIIAVTENMLIVVNDDGSEFDGWPKALEVIPNLTSIRDYLSCPAIGDINGDGNLDIALGWLDGYLYAWTAVGGAPLTNFPVRIVTSGTEFEQYVRSPALGNIDGEPLPEIIVSSGNGKLHAVKANGSLLPGFPIQLEGVIYGSVGIWDFDYNGYVNMVVQANSSMLLVYDFPSVQFRVSEQPWPMFRHDVRKSGSMEAPVALDAPAAPGGTLSAPALAAVHPPRPNPFNPRVELPFDVPDGGARVRIRVFDLAGREVRKLSDGRFPAGQYRISWDGRLANGVRLASGVYFAFVEIGGESFVQKLTLLK